MICVCGLWVVHKSLYLQNGSNQAIPEKLYLQNFIKSLSSQKFLPINFFNAPYGNRAKQKAPLPIYRAEK